MRWPMKRMIKLFSAFVLGSAILAASGMVAEATTESSYTYNYDYWGDVQDSPDFYNISKVFTSLDFGLEQGFNAPNGLFVKDQTAYVCDTGNNRIVVLQRTSKEKFDVVDIVDSVSGNPLNAPTDVAVDDEGNMFIADSGNNHIVKIDKNKNFVMEFTKPDAQGIDKDAVYTPTKIAIDTAGRVYCIATGVNKGLIKYENDGTFSGFVGATKTPYDFTDYLYKKFATQEQRAQMENFVPTEYDNLYMDYEGFIYAVTGKADPADIRAEKIDAVRKLNLLGSDILVRNGEWPVYGDLYFGSGGGYEGPSYFADVTTFENDIYVCLDKNRARLFGYNDQGKMVFAFGGNGNLDGYFRKPIAIEHMGHDILVLDALDCTISLFTPTEFGTLVYSAIDQFDDGNYEASEASWREVLRIDGNYDLAYIGVGRALLRQERYKEAMEYFELKYDGDNYSKAFKQYRKEWVEKNIAIIIVILLALFLIPMAIGKYKSIQYEIRTADIFKR